MKSRPLPVTIIAWLYVVAGVVGLTYHAARFNVARPFDDDGVWVLLVRLLALVAGVFLLRGRNWARWLAVAWMSWHVGLSLFHPVTELIMHSVLLVVIAFLLFRASATAFFRNSRVKPSPGG